MSAVPRPPPTCSTEQRPKPKRIKIDVACDTCRARKVRCDGLRPACGNCMKKVALRDKCTYSQNSGTSAPKPSWEVDSLSPTRREYPRQERPKGKSSSMQVNESSFLADAHTFGPSGQPRPAQISASPDRSAGDISSSTRQTANNESPSIIDSMNALMDEGASTREYFGSSSAGSFTAQISKAIEAKLGQSNRSLSVRGNNNTSKPRLASSISSRPIVDDANSVLPTRRQADQLLSLYWTYVDPLYPFLDRLKWDEFYRGIFDGSSIDTDERCFLATLNVIFALSTQLIESQTQEQRDESSTIYFNRAQDLLPLNTWESGSIELVQYLLLASQYLQSSQNPHQTWMTVGSAVRIAQGLGLHLHDKSWEHSDPDESDLQRRIWYGCILMDRMVTVTHGRPSMVSLCLASVVPTPTYSTTVQVGENSGPRTDAAFFVKSVELYEIIYRTVRAVYGGTGARSKDVLASGQQTPPKDVDQVDLGMVLELDKALAGWERNLPERLKWPSTISRDDITTRQSLILYIRFLHARVLLLRPVLASFCLAPQAELRGISDTLESRVIRESAIMCVSTAQGIISTLLKYQTRDGTIGLLPAWWYRVYYVYTAATVLIAAKLRPGVFSDEDLGDSWTQALTILKSHENFGQSARRCLAGLHFLSTKLVQDTTTYEQSGGTLRGEITQEQQTSHGFLNEQAADNFFFSDLDHLGFQDVDFDFNNLSWLNDMQATWELLNHA